MSPFPARALALGLAVLVAGCSGEARQTPGPGFDGARAFAHVREMVAIGPRPAGSAGADRTRAYITAELDRLGIAWTTQAFEAATPLGAVRMANLIATLPGERTDRIALATHFDTKLFRDITFVGANDGGSSTGAVLELARVLKDRPRSFT
ncbi:MAG: M28 family peptidase, partial [Vicinamibacteria bacterium]